MGFKRIVAIAEITYPADDPRTLDELREVTSQGIIAGTEQLGSNGHYVTIHNASVDPDPEPTLPDVPDPREQQGFAP